MTQVDTNIVSVFVTHWMSRKTFVSTCI